VANAAPTIRQSDQLLRVDPRISLHGSRSHLPTPFRIGLVAIPRTR
jgi:hypothetical protein